MRPLYPPPPGYGSKAPHLPPMAMAMAMRATRKKRKLMKTNLKKSQKQKRPRMTNHPTTVTQTLRMTINQNPAKKGRFLQIRCLSTIAKRWLVGNLQDLLKMKQKCQRRRATKMWVTPRSSQLDRSLILVLTGCFRQH